MNLVYVTAEDIWILKEPYTNRQFNIPIPKGYRTNLASTPRFLWFFAASYELSEAAALVHDWLYDHAGITVSIGGVERIVKKSEADKIFRRIMRREGVPAWRRFPAYWAVRIFAGWAWRICAKRNKK